MKEREEGVARTSRTCPVFRCVVCTIDLTPPRTLISVSFLSFAFAFSQREFRKLLNAAKHVVFLTGAGISAESGIPTFRGAGGLWRQFQVFDVATYDAFERDPSLVWEFYHYRRQVVATCSPNPGHLALAQFQQRCKAEGRKCTIITQNIDRLHQASGADDVIEMHGSLWLLKKAARGDKHFMEEVGVVWEDRTTPLVPALEDKGRPDEQQRTGSVAVADLPHRDGALLRPAVVWFGESLDPRVMSRVDEAVGSCDLFVVVGTSGVVQPAADLARKVARRGVAVAEVNLDPSANDDACKYIFHGRSGELLPKLLRPQQQEEDEEESEGGKEGQKG